MYTIAAKQSDLPQGTKRCLITFRGVEPIWCFIRLNANDAN
jgi:hypothetical protein